jgi:DNA helicase-2/ATP-dependent DNA helicase PcrA
VIETRQLKARASNSLFAFLDLIERLARQVQDLPLHKKVEEVKMASGLIAHYEKGTKEEAQRRSENLDELENAARQFEWIKKESTTILTDFLDHAALEAGEVQGSKFDDCVQLMTLHSAKGLEFEIVFLCGLEEGLFPHQNSLDDGKLEEERRLCYVGITRARQLLYICHSESRYSYGKRESSTPSRFIREMPAELIKEVRLRTVSQFSARRQVEGLQVGERVKHRKFGEGIVLDCEGEGQFARVLIKFSHGNKWLMQAYAGLEKIFNCVKSKTL